ncbi:Cysteine desulfuration protein SufE [Pararhodospirillum photometricum DSM 122]|uniref:Cysteine desulfuration protein SufE n=1 Tax=Pararhodospirillum photometricum DSM 122 TaxID=1150469 RepID=H6SJD1_PARPM|nr:Cysteine desulfuration protein SufE [Pararhodospirillum photometricum DSM 122]
MWYKRGLLTRILETTVTDLSTLTLEGLADTFALFDDWEDRYRYLIDLGRSLPEFPEAARTEAAKVQGCMSQVWLVPVVQPGPPKRLHFLIDSDAHIVRGLAAVMVVLFSGKTPQEILAVDPDQALQTLGLESHISPNRRNGVASMAQVIKKAAQAALA